MKKLFLYLFAHDNLFSSLKIRGKHSREEMIEQLITEGFDMVLVTGYSSHYQAYSGLVQTFGMDLLLSDNLDIIKSNTIAAKVTLGVGTNVRIFQLL